ncbi:MAG: uroporphyrinogen-III C-methyltransferase [Paraperlucidibaca sp.]|jgi:uroporphyrin-III C-methyltransferase/precorrin-2 dehydrogenase/sirohydrochlorin ferrochelatase|uniref:siroheme synthase CysG n=1 Tax=Paraperlucidibaca sp. TaxID=2708021 RepID=UPI001B3FACD3|nr:uroporphyrinogen-III C-methyltransferase [Paraperlucidibaca sp.]MBQ0722422.1 uroporphyrinogen-III C-methyltransferase [Paraperlucidibaca sp.]MBQ0843041.1 uroporphyrinogen-III C-methyltransferase [Paraperlucidibaca sp.]|tara:strand:+ start:3205 stop:4590 length:1386 start_codon:yes stop_codon:yes gene_type:complete
MDTLPLGFRLKDKPCLLVGGGEIAQRKASLLLRAGARIHLVALEVIPALREAVEAHGGRVSLRGYDSGDIESNILVVAATDKLDLNAQVSADAQSRGIPVNVVDAPALCTVIFPAIVDRSPLLIGISSNGVSPVLARILRGKIESMIPAAYGRLAELLGEFRNKAKVRFPDVSARRLFWETQLDGSMPELVFSGRVDEARTVIEQAIANPDQRGAGEVYLVGAGPGDPDLLTFKALRLMQQADVVVYDRLVSAPILDLCRRDAERIYVGKARADHALPQEGINALLVRLAQEGKRVCRLKGGDPFIFGRGGEEIEELSEAGVSFQVVPGITAASGCSAYAGIPLTHRDYAQSVRFVTGHLKNGTPDLPWAELVHPNQTLVLYMGLTSLGPIREQLLAHGLAATTPVAMISKGTTPDQRVVIGTLENIETQLANEPLPAPTLIIVGEVVELRSRLNWFVPLS